MNYLDHVWAIDYTPELKKPMETIAMLFGSAGGIIIVLVNKGGEAMYYAEGQSFHDFGIDTEMECPMVYRKVSVALKRIENIKEAYGEEWFKERESTIYLALWVHPDSGNPLSYYIQMGGFEFPGCPTQ